MSARNLGTFSRPGRRATMAYAVILGCALAGASACSAGSSETSPTATTSAAATAPADPASTSPTPAGASASAVASASAQASSAAEPAPDAVLKITVRGRTITPTPGRKSVSVGDRVRLVVTTDTANTLHVHGVEIEKDTKPGVPLTVDFTVTDPGVYAVELHHPELLLVQLVVR